MKSGIWMGLVLTMVIVLAGCTRGQSAESTEVALMLEDNSCAIACPRTSVYPGQRGSIECGQGYVPSCQCSDPDLAIARCESAE